MPYSVPAGNQVALEFENSYTAPPGDQISVPFGDVVPVPVAVPDSYSTTYNHSLSVAAPGVLADDTLNGATVALSTPAAHGVVTFHSDGSFDYVPTSGYSGSDTFAYRLTNTWGTSTATVTITIAPLPPTQRYTYAAARLPWNTAPRRMRSVGATWARSTQVRLSTGIEWEHAPATQRDVGLGWSLAPRVRMSVAMAWGTAPVVRGLAPALPWSRPPRLALSVALPWGGQPRHQVGAGVPWRAPPNRELGIALPWTGRPRHQVDAALVWRRPPQRTRRWFLPWNYAPRVPWIVHGIGVLPPPPHEPPGYQPPRGDRVAPRFMCPQLAFAGDELRIPFGPAACYFAWPKPRVYIVENSAAVVRLPERTPISVDSVDVAITVDDMHWSFEISLADPADLELLKADIDGPKVVEVSLNGFVWTAIVENYEQDRQHPGRKVKVSGRSQTALLDAPYAPPRSRVVDVDRQAQQLVDDELDLTGFTADYETLTWLVLGGAWHYDGRTAAAAIKSIAAAAGAVAIADPWDKVVRIAPRYAASPWSWSTTGADKFIQDDIILRDSARLVSKPLYDYVLVSGDQVGVSDPIMRDGSAGTTRAEMIVDALITDHDVALERGRNVLCDRGQQMQVDVTIPLFAADVAGQPGLISPLDLVEVVEPTSWKALALGVSISARMQDLGNGRAVLVIEQTLTLERHITDAG
jgi:hypothetical protein